MRAQKNLLRVGALFAALVVLLVNVPLTQAATPNGAGNGLRVSPVRTDETIKPGETKTVNINVTNVTAAGATFQAIINDFMANPNESGQPAVILDPKQYAASHSLKRFVQPVANFTLDAGQQKTVPVTIKVPASAAAGGYYGAVRFAPANTKNESGKNVSLAGSVGSLILVKVPGDIKEQLNIVSFDVRKKDSPSSFFTTNKNLDAVVRFQNQGNIQEQPFGKILLKNRSGKTLATYEVNTPDQTGQAGNVLPDSIRKFTIPLKDKVGSFGQYKVEGNFGYGSKGQLLTASTTFYVIPLAVIIGFIVLVLLIVFLIFGLPRLIKIYNQRVISKSRRR